MAEAVAPDLRLITRRRGAERDGTAPVSRLTVAVVGFVVVAPLVALAEVAWHPPSGARDGSVVALARPALIGAMQATASTITCVVLGVALAWMLYRRPVPGQRLAHLVLAVPFILPSIAVAAGVGALVRSDGWLGSIGLGGTPIGGSLTAIVVAHTVFNTGLVTRHVALAVRSIDQRCLDASRVLGVGLWRRVRRVIWPALAPTILRVGGLVWVLCFTSFGVVLVLGRPSDRTVDVELWYRITALFEVRSAAVGGLVQFAFLALILGILQRRSVRVSARPGTEPRRPFRAGMFGVVVAVALVAAPLAALVSRSLVGRNGIDFDHLVAAFGGGGGGLRAQRLRQVWGPGGASGAVARSLGLAVLTAAVTAAAVACVAPALVRRRTRWTEWVLSAQLAFSPVLLGFAALMANGRLGRLALVPYALLTVVHASLAVPMAVGVTVAAVDDGLRRRLELARTLGLDSGQVFVRVLLVHLRPQLLYAAALGAALSLGDSAAASLIAPGSKPTVAVAAQAMLTRSTPGFFDAGLTVSLALSVAVGLIFLMADVAGSSRRTRRNRRPATLHRALDPSPIV